MTSFLILQWNAQGMWGHGEELTKWLFSQKSKPFDLLCVQETWFEQNNILSIPNYKVIPRNRDGPRGGCAFYIHNSIAFDLPPQNHLSNIEAQLIKIHFEKESLYIVNFYNPCKKLHPSILEPLLANVGDASGVILLGDFNSHNAMWGSPSTNQNGKTLENFIIDNNLMILNDGSGTRLDPRTGKLSHLDITLASPQIANRCYWKVAANKLGSDHFPVITEIHSFLRKPQCDKEDLTFDFPTYKNIDGKKFSKKCQKFFDNFQIPIDTLSFYETFMAHLKDSIIESMPPKRNKSKKVKDPTPWWTKECSERIKERNKARNKLKKDISFEKIEDYKKKKAIAQKTLRRAKYSYWEHICSKLNRTTSISHLWSTVRQLNGATSNNAKNIPTLHEDDKSFETNNEKANVFAHFFQAVGEPNITPSDLSIIQKELDIIIAENHNFSHLIINEPFTQQELNEALYTENQSAPGKDGITYSIYKMLPESVRLILLKLYNNMWSTGIFPPECKHAILVPILKHGKPSNQVSSYRPIALTPCFTKIMEKMVDKRLQWYSEKHNILPSIQNGFRKGRSTTLNITHLENEVQKSLNTKGETLAIFVDLLKAYDRLLIKGLLVKCARVGLRGNILTFIQNFLTKRTFQVKIGETASLTKTLDNGIPQGCIISPFLFNLMVYDIPTSPVINSLLYADDYLLWKSGRNLKFTSNAVQNHLNTVNKWLNSWGLTISEEKTVGIIFSRNSKTNFQPIELNGKKITFKDEHKFLGVTFDKKLTWAPHINNIAIRCKQKLNVLKGMAATKGFNSFKNLLLIYRAIIRSTIDYGCEAYDSACQSVKKTLDSIQYQALSICLGSLKGTSLQTLQVESGEMPLDIRRKMLSQKFRILVEKEESKPLTQSVKDCWQYHFASSKSKHPPFGQRTSPIDGIDTGSMKINKILPFPPWHLHKPCISTDLANIISKDDHPALLLQRSLEIIHIKWGNFIHSYTDGSKMPDSGRTSAAFHIPYINKTEAKRLQNNISIFRAELTAILLLLSWINENIHETKKSLVIFSDSLSALKAIQNSHKESMIIEIMFLVTQLHYKGIKIYMEWIPGHCGIKGNDIVDYSAKTAIGNTIDIPLDLNKTEIKSLLKKHFTDMWQLRWEEDSSFLKSIHKVVSKPHTYNLSQRKHEILLFRMRSGNVGLNSNLQKLGKRETGLCDYCDQSETIQHFQLECPN